jgi:hypothetical protein
MLAAVEVVEIQIHHLLQMGLVAQVVVAMLEHLQRLAQLTQVAAVEVVKAVLFYTMVRQAALASSLSNTQ